MILTNDMIKCQLENYSNKNNKISRDIANGKIVKIKKGLYETNPSIPGYLLSSSIYGPSYLSFDFALYYYELIPEKALCDKLYTLNSVKNLAELENLLFNDLRIDREEFRKANPQFKVDNSNLASSVQEIEYFEDLYSRMGWLI